LQIKAKPKPRIYPVQFQANLGKQKTLDQWAEWLEAVVDQILAPYHDKPLPEIAHVAKQFLLKWSFYR
jgi:regulatory factor X 1/2/3